MKKRSVQSIKPRPSCQKQAHAVTPLLQDDQKKACRDILAICLFCNYVFH